MNYQENQIEHEKNLKFIFELSSEFEIKEEEYIRRIDQMEAEFDKSEKSKVEIHQKYEEELIGLRE